VWLAIIGPRHSEGSLRATKEPHPTEDEIVATPDRPRGVFARAPAGEAGQRMSRTVAVARRSPELATVPTATLGSLLRDRKRVYLVSASTEGATPDRSINLASEERCQVKTWIA